MIYRAIGIRIRSELYLRAIQCLQTTLNDPVEGSHSTTFCAVAILSYVEIFGQPDCTGNYLSHVRGAEGRICRRGLACAQDELGKAMLYSS